MEDNMISENAEKLSRMPSKDWTMINVACMLTEIYSDMKYVKFAIEGKANKWVERVMGMLMVGMAAWVGKQILGLIETAKALF